MVTILAFIVLGGISYAATGGKFILGQSNSANQPTSLTSGAASALKVANTNGGNVVLASGGWAFNASGNATQRRGKGGFVKAMAFVDEGTYPSDPIRQCFNSQLPPSRATSGNCGITWSINGKVHSLDFGFKVDDRFVSVAEAGYVNDTLTVYPGSTDVLNVYGWTPATGNVDPDAYWIIVY
jgi:hypothetical protein